MAPEPAKRTRNSEKTIAALKAAMTKQLIEKGFAGLSLQPVLAEAGISKGAMFHHFPTKSHLVAAAFSDLLALFAERISDLGAQLRAGEISQTVYVDGLVATFVSDMFIGSMEIALRIRVEPELSDLVAVAVDKWREDLEGSWMETFDLCDRPASEARWHWAMASNLLRGHAFTSTFGVTPEARSKFIQEFEHLILRQAVIKKTAEPTTKKPPTNMEPS